MKRKRNHRQAYERLESRRLLSGAAPTAVNDSYSIGSDHELIVGAGITSLTFNGNSSIYTGSHTWTTADGVFSGDGTGDSAHVHFASAADNWDLYFGSADGALLAPGTYNNAVRFLFQGPGQPGLDVRGNGHGSDTVTGNFTILQIATDESGYLTNFAADFTQYTNGEAQPLNGSVRYHYVPAGYKSGVLANDSDPESDALTASVVSDVTHGNLILNSDGTLDYTPDNGYVGSDSFTYRANDGTSNSNLATVTINVTAVNHAPSFTVGANQTVNEDAAAQSINNWATAISPGPAGSGESGQTVSFLVTGNTYPGLFNVAPAVDSAGKLTYTLKPNAYGVATITLVAKDNGGTLNGGVDTSDPQSFTITVNPVNDAPVAVNDAYSTAVNTAIVIAAAPVQNSLTLTSASGDPIGLGANKTLTTSQGTFALSLNGDNGVGVYFQGNGTTSTDNWFLDFTMPGGNLLQPGTYTNVALYPNQADNTPGLAVSGNGHYPTSVTGQFFVRQIAYDVSNNPTALSADFTQFANGSSAALSGTIQYNYRANVGVLANDSDAESSKLTASVVTGPTHGTLTLNADGSFTYTPTSGYSGADSFTYRANDGTTNSNTATVSITVGSVAAPVVTGQTPAPGATLVPVTTTVTATFNVSVQPGTIVFTLKDSNNNPVAATVTYDDVTHTATLTPSAPLAGAATYTASMSGAKNTSGVAMSGTVTWSFSTVFAWKSGLSLNVQFDNTGNAVGLSNSGGTITATQSGATLTFTGVTSILVNGTAANNTLNYDQVSVPLNFNNGAGHDVFNVNTGTYQLNADVWPGGAAPVNLTLNVKSGATAVLNATQHLEALNITGGTATFLANGNRYLSTGALSLDAAAKLDLNDNDLIVNYGTGANPFATVRGWIFAGYSGSPDATKKGITSTVGQSAGNTILALIDNALLGTADWPIGSGNTIGTNTLIGKYTYFGDANFDGQVTADDYGVLDANFGATPPAGVAWLSGDANLDGTITSDDYGILDANLGSGAGHPLSPASASVLAPSMELSPWMRVKRKQISIDN